MSNNYFEEMFIEETFQEEVMGNNTSRNFLLDYLIMIKKINKDNKWIQENLKKLELHKTLKDTKKYLL